MVRKLAYALESATLAAAIFGFLDKEALKWNTPLYWGFVGLVFVITLILHDKLE